MEINMLVGRKKLEWIAYNLVMTDHSKVRMRQRDENDRNDMKERILNSPLAWKTYNNRICIALNLYEYIVVDPTARDEYGKQYHLCWHFLTQKHMEQQ